jgi:hypothetical protein
VPENKLTQDVKTRWRSTHGMTDSLRVNQEPLLLYEVRNAKVASIRMQILHPDGCKKKDHFGCDILGKKNSRRTEFYLRVSGSRAPKSLPGPQYLLASESISI